MRILCLVFLVVIVVAVGGFAWQNHENVSLKFWEEKVDVPLVGVLGGVYVLGMLTGWSVIGLLRRSWDTATDFRARETAQTR